MSMRIVTGHTPEPQVTAALEGLWKAGVAGEGAYVLPVLDRLACTVDTANQVTVGTGAVVLHGRECACETPTPLTVESGTQAMKRRDLVCARYHREGAGGQAVESASLVVLRGAPHATEPKDPEVPAGSVLAGAADAYMPLWRLPLSGINLGQPERLFSLLPSLASLATPSPWEYLWRSGSYYVAYMTVGRTVLLEWDVPNVGASGWWAEDALLPDELRPPGISHYAASAVYNSNNTAIVWVPRRGDPERRVWLASHGGTARMVGSTSWPY